MKRIVIDARIITSSTGRYVERLVEHLQKIDHENEYLVLVRPKDKNYWQPKAKNFKLVEAPFADFGLGEQFGLYRLLKRLKPDLVHFPMPQHPLLYRKKFVSTVHDLTMLEYSHREWYKLWYQLKRMVFKLIFKRTLRRAEQIIVPTNFVKNELNTKYQIPNTKITVTHEAADALGVESKVHKVSKVKGQKLSNLQPSTFNSQKTLHGKRFLLYVGQASPYKNLERLIQAFQILTYNQPPATNNQLKLVIVGKKTKWHKKLELLVTSYKLQEHVVFTGFVPDEQLAWLYSRAEAYVFPSLSEGFGLPGLEAMVHGCPVIAAGNSSMPEVYGDAALYFDPYSVDDIATVISEVLVDENLRQKMIAAGREQAKKYSWAKLAQETHEIYMHELRSK